MTLPIIVKESNVWTNTTADPIITKILSQSNVSDENKLNQIREAYMLNIPESLLTENLTVDQIKTLPVLSEWNLSWAGKLFFASAAAYIAGKVIKNMPLKIKGTKPQVQAITDAIIASKAFQDELKRPGASIESVVKKLNLRNMTRQKFEQMTGHIFPL